MTIGVISDISEIQIHRHTMTNQDEPWHRAIMISRHLYMHLGNSVKRIGERIWVMCWCLGVESTYSNFCQWFHRYRRSPISPFRLYLCRLTAIVRDAGWKRHDEGLHWELKVELSCVQWTCSNEEWGNSGWIIAARSRRKIFRISSLGYQEK